MPGMAKTNTSCASLETQPYIADLCAQCLDMHQQVSSVADSSPMNHVDVHALQDINLMPTYSWSAQSISLDFPFFSHL